MKRSPITTHVLDLTAGRPAAGLAATLEFRAPEGWKRLSQAATDEDGRISTFLEPDAHLTPGHYRLTFATESWFSARALKAFYPEVAITFVVEQSTEHFHVPLLLGPFSYSTYRGS